MAQAMLRVAKIAVVWAIMLYSMELIQRKGYKQCGGYILLLSTNPPIETTYYLNSTYHIDNIRTIYLYCTCNYLFRVY
jgi:hypothetical protein